MNEWNHLVGWEPSFSHPILKMDRRPDVFLPKCEQERVLKGFLFNKNIIRPDSRLKKSIT
jgi:hypothetical protein